MADLTPRARAAAPLPIDPLLPEVIEALTAAPGRDRPPNAVIVAPPGAGKTTRVPPALLDAPFARAGAIVLLQPRRIAARAAAARIAEERGGRVGDEIGYHIRFDNRTGPRTRLRVVTEGILARQAQADPFLEGVACVVLDEFHERSIHTDVALAMVREIQRSVREDLRIVVMSATLAPGPVAEFLGDTAGGPAPVFVSQGRMHPVAIEHLERSDARPLPEQCADAIARAMGEDDAGDPEHVLVFLPGLGEIRRTESLIRERGLAREAEVHVLHSAISPEAQDRTLRPGARRKLILATNIAETSLTIDGVRTVIDGGWVRVLVNDARRGIDRLELRRVSRASAEQRAGRAGRTAPGRCLRLWTRAEDAALAPAEVSEIHRIDLAAAALALHAFGAADLAKFPWFEPPRAEALARAEALLAMLGALDARGVLTPLGTRLAALPLHPRIGRLLLAGTDAGRLREAATMAALLSEKKIVREAIQPARAARGRRREAAWEGDSDLLERLEWFERATGDGAAGGAGACDPELDLGAIQAVARVRDELMRLMRRGDRRKGPIER